MIWRETLRFHCQLSGCLKFGSTAKSVVEVPTPTAAFFSPGLIVSRLRQVGQSARLSLSPCQPVSTVLVHGGFEAILSSEAITLEREMYRPKPSRTAVLPSPLMSQA